MQEQTDGARQLLVSDHLNDVYWPGQVFPAEMALVLIQNLMLASAVRPDGTQAT